MWFEYWVNLSETTDKPIYFFRFEDIMANPEEELVKLFRFILGMDSLEGTVIEQRIKLLEWAQRRRRLTSLAAVALTKIWQTIYPNSSNSRRTTTRKYSTFSAMLRMRR